jgi:hypothetical protein
MRQNEQKAERILITNTKQRASAVLVKFYDYKDSVVREAGILRGGRVPTMRSRDVLLQAQGGSSWLSPLSLDGSRDDKAGEAGPVELQLSGGQESQN